MVLSHAYLHVTQINIHMYMYMYMYMYKDVSDKFTKCTCTDIIMYPEVVVERSILHVLHHNHGRFHSGHYSIQFDDIGVVKLAHDGGLRQEIIAHLQAGARLYSKKTTMLYYDVHMINKL